MIESSTVIVRWTFPGQGPGGETYETAGILQENTRDAMTLVPTVKVAPTHACIGPPVVIAWDTVDEAYTTRYGTPVARP
jgi:hypothetical protein